MAYNSISRWSGAPGAGARGAGVFGMGLLGAGLVGFSAMIAIVGPAHAEPRAVVELFTSQGCSACPPADKIIGELAKDPSVIALSMPIDYWDYLGWKDTLADARFSARQKAYSQMRGDREVYTPQVVVNGSAHVVGSDREGIDGAIGDTKKADGVMSVPVAMALAGKQIYVTVAASGKGPYHNVVRNLLKVGDWNGSSGSWTVPLENISRDGVDAAVVYVQDGNRDKPGPMLGAAFTSLH